jgi:hypothetical protein
MKYTDENIDELFRRAAESYPLKVKTQNWNKVIIKLYQPSTSKEAGWEKISNKEE